MKYVALSPRLHIADFQCSVAFYRDVLESSVDSVFPEEQPQFALLSRDRVAMQIGGAAGRETDAATPPVTLYLEADDARAAHAALQDRVKVEWGPEVFFYQRREFAFRDPDGHLIIVS